MSRSQPSPPPTLYHVKLNYNVSVRDPLKPSKLKKKKSNKSAIIINKGERGGESKTQGKGEPSRRSEERRGDREKEEK